MLIKMICLVMLLVPSIFTVPSLKDLVLFITWLSLHLVDATISAPRRAISTSKRVVNVNSQPEQCQINLQTELPHKKDISAKMFHFKHFSKDVLLKPFRIRNKNYFQHKIFTYEILPWIFYSTINGKYTTVSKPKSSTETPSICRPASSMLLSSRYCVSFISISI